MRADGNLNIETHGVFVVVNESTIVKAGLTWPWSNGPVEGHIHRLKLLKWSMYGRAGLDLLSRRFLLVA